MAGYSFKVNELVTVDGTTVKPKKITVFIGPIILVKVNHLKKFVLRFWVIQRWAIPEGS